MKRTYRKPYGGQHTWRYVVPATHWGGEYDERPLVFFSTTYSAAALLILEHATSDPMWISELHAMFVAREMNAESRWADEIEADTGEPYRTASLEEARLRCAYALANAAAKLARRGVIDRFTASCWVALADIERESFYGGAS